MLSKEQLEKIANPGPVDVGGAQNPVITEMAIELLESRAESLALREQLAELKALPPVAWRWRFCAQNVVTLDKDRAEKSNEMGVDDFTELFTAAKPEALPRHVFSMLVNELRDVPAIGCKRELIIGVLNRHGVTAEPVQCDPPAAE
ncbi:TPA: polyphosphate kinase [Yersinia enterocolitica]|uniref:polyphosphate kinase n=1 Tax=Yersinia enterocolitica TaxID=630 RepID=UPI003771FD09